MPKETETCQDQRCVVVCPVLTKEFASRIQTYLIDVQPVANIITSGGSVDHVRNYSYADFKTYIRGCPSASGYFLAVWCASAGQNDNGTEFIFEVIRELNAVWPRLVVVDGKPRHLLSWIGQRVLFKTCLECGWVTTTLMTGRWELNLSKFQKNSNLYSRIRRSPYPALFGCDAKVDIFFAMGHYWASAKWRWSSVSRWQRIHLIPQQVPVVPIRLPYRYQLAKNLKP